MNLRVTLRTNLWANTFGEKFVILNADANPKSKI